MTAITIQQGFDLALLHHKAGRLHEAEQLYRQILAQQPAHVDANHLLGVIAHQTGRHDLAIELIRRAIVLRPGFAQAHSNLSLALKEKGLIEDAIAACRQAIILMPNFAEAYHNLGIALDDKGEFEQAIAAYREAIVLAPNAAKSYSSLGNALGRRGEFDQAIAAHRQAIALARDSSEAHNNLGNALKDSGQLDQAIAAYREAIAINAGNVGAHSNLLYALHFHSDYDSRAIAEEHRRWNRQHAEPLAPSWQSFPNDRDPGRRLRIGYVSPDFREHPVGRFFGLLIDHHDRARFEIFCYSDVLIGDSITERIRSRADVWRNIVGLTDEAAATAMRRDSIDILVDLTMHMARNRLPAFARKPAPVQVTYLAYCSTTGLTAIDYRLTDPHLDPPAVRPVQPPGESEQCYSEESFRLPLYWCYEPGAGTPDVAPLPALSDGRVTFGCLNNFAKVSPEALGAWIELLRALPSSRLLLHAHRGEHRRRTLDRLNRGGVDPERLTFVDFLHRPDYLRQYHQIDIGLDPFPFAGGTTTCDALWMGVPVITLAGRTAVGRSGVTLLSSVDLGELVAATPQDYVRRAAELAADLPRLAELRSGLRQRMLRSPLTDAPKFARGIEDAYRQMWRRWRQSAPESG